MRPDAGTVSVFGLTYGEREKEIKERIGYVGEEQYFYPDKSVAWTAQFMSSFYSSWDWGRFTALAGNFGIERSLRVGRLSRGRRTLLSLAFALSHGADLLILDEPTAGLDLVLRRDILGLLRDFVTDDGKAVILSSHITDAVGDVADYVALLSEGKLVLHEEKDELLSNWKWIHFKEGAVGPDITEALFTVERRALGSAGLTMDFPSIEARLGDAISSGDVKVTGATLDDVLVAALKGA
jgi:ABC-2 type transport system ATP-binding protein